jgi:hypothetical protein
LKEALNRLRGRKESDESEFDLDPSELVDLLAETVARRGSDAANVIAVRCGTDQMCARRLQMEASVRASETDFQIRTSIAHLRRLIDYLAPTSGRKTLVLVSSGLALSDRPGVGPDVGSVALELGQAAARADVSVYTLFLDNTILSYYAPDRRTSAKTMNPGRSSAIRSRWLEQFTGAAGGDLFRVTVGNGEAALQRIVQRTSSYYLLGVDVLDSDRTGKPLPIRIGVQRKGLKVQSRRWVVVR